MGFSIKKILARSIWLTDNVNYGILLIQILKKFSKKENCWKVPTSSRDYYDAYDDREHNAYFDGSRILCRERGVNKWMTYPEAKVKYLAPIIAEIEKLLLTKKSVTVLEVGCGNCINIVELKKRFLEKVKFSGTDISSGRIDVAKKYFGKQLDEVDITVQSITEPTPKSDFESYDMVFTMHCLEQIPYAVAPAVQGLWQRAKSVVVMVEPVWEFARPVQKLKLVRSDYIRTLLPTVRYLGYNILRAEPLGFESSQKNQSSVIVIGK